MVYTYNASLGCICIFYVLMIIVYFCDDIYATENKYNEGQVNEDVNRNIKLMKRNIEENYTDETTNASTLVPTTSSPSLNTTQPSENITIMIYQRYRYFLSSKHRIGENIPVHPELTINFKNKLKERISNEDGSASLSHKIADSENAADSGSSHNELHTSMTTLLDQRTTDESETYPTKTNSETDLKKSIIQTILDTKSQVEKEETNSYTYGEFVGAVVSAAQSGVIVTFIAIVCIFVALCKKGVLTIGSFYKTPVQPITRQQQAWEKTKLKHAKYSKKRSKTNEQSSTKHNTMNGHKEERHSNNISRQKKNTSKRKKLRKKNNLPDLEFGWKSNQPKSDTKRQNFLFEFFNETSKSKQKRREEKQKRKYIN